jgi:hypothetical protein
VGVVLTFRELICYSPRNRRFNVVNFYPIKRCRKVLKKKLRRFNQFKLRLIGYR